MTKIITVDNIKMSYRATPILNGVSFIMEKGESVSLIGSNGAGKSTLIRCVLGLETISNGKINLFGNEIKM